MVGFLFLITNESAIDVSLVFVL